ncbi:MAG TPA: HAMP domain-containing sensor histidine kinase [Acidobacteriaceae bacterium]|nr:HAMP domain-containing sensor histidine kinase [Acidobacteriaceae bacterium]
MSSATGKGFSLTPRPSRKNAKPFSSLENGPNDAGSGLQPQGKSSRVHSAAWRISLWGTVAFACGTLIIFMSLHSFVAKDIQRRTDAWISGEVETLSDVAERTPKNALYGRVVGEMAELASREVPNRPPRPGELQTAPVFFLQTGADGAPVLWAGDGDGRPYLNAIRGVNAQPDTPFDLHVADIKVPFRVAEVVIPDGSHVYLGLSERDELHVLHQMREHFMKLWALCVLLGFAIIFYTTRRMLGDVRRISEVAAHIGESDLSRRVPTSGWNDEIAQLSSTLNRMLERIEQSVHQLHTITNSLAHDLRSPLTAIRARLEIVLTRDVQEQDAESIERAINEIDRLTEILNQSLDVAEAQAHALRLEAERVDLEQLLDGMIELYRPCMSDRGLRLEFSAGQPLEVMADAALVHRMVANLLDNEMKHLPPSRTVSIALRAAGEFAEIVVEDDGPGFSPEIESELFKQGVRGSASRGYGLGLAFVQAVAGAHGGSVRAENHEGGGARLIVQLPLAARAVSTEAVVSAD